MPLENLKTKLHAIFENCGMQHEEIVVKEDALPPQTSQEQDYKDVSGIVYKISQDPTTKQYVVKDQTGNQKDTFTLEQKDMDGGVSKDVRNGVVQQLTPEASQIPPVTEPIKPEQPTNPTEPVEAPVAEQTLAEVDEKTAANFKAQYGDDWKKVYYATANAQNRNPETFEKK